MLDLEIRARTRGARSLDDVFRLLYRRFYADAPAVTYYLKGRGYRAADFLAAVNEVSAFAGSARKGGSAGDALDGFIDIDPRDYWLDPRNELERLYRRYREMRSSNT